FIQGQSVANQKVLDPPVSNTSQSQHGSTVREFNCKFLSVMGQNDVVAHGHWVTNHPNKIVHFKPLGPNASMVWVTLAKELLATLWRASMDVDTI
ncbi:hypothetical protein GIB67_008109, partial [Kingdonia uniflora]